MRWGAWDARVGGWEWVYTTLAGAGLGVVERGGVGWGGPYHRVVRLHRSCVPFNDILRSNPDELNALGPDLFEKDLPSKWVG